MSSRSSLYLNSARFVHNLSKSKSFEEASREAGISAGGGDAAKILEQALESQKMSVDRMDYFNILNSMFSQVLGQDRQFDLLHLFDSARDYFSARIADGLDMDSIASGMNGLQIWSQTMAAISEEEAQNLQLVTVSRLYLPEYVHVQISVCLAGISKQKLAPG